MAYFNAVYTALVRQIPCAVCGEVSGRIEFYEHHKTTWQEYWTLKPLYPRQGVMETARRVVGTMPKCGGCAPVPGVPLKTITNEDVNDLIVSIQRRRVRFGDYRAVMYPGE